MLVSYGEKGSIIIFWVLQVLFPAKDFHELSFINFLRRVLIPETAVCLAQEDMKIDRQTAIDILRTSRQYGLVMHPSDESADGEEYWRRCVQKQKGKENAGVLREL